MNPNRNPPYSHWPNQQHKPFHGNDYISHNKAEYLTPGQKAFPGGTNSLWSANAKENKLTFNWKPSSKFPAPKDDFGFRSNTGQYNNSNENHKGPCFLQSADQPPTRPSYFDHDDLLSSKIAEQEFEFSRLSSTPQNFRLEYVEYNDLPHISQLNPATSK